MSSATFPVVEATIGGIHAAFRDGRIGVMDYYNLKNLQADTGMRSSIAGLGNEGQGGNSRPT